MQRRVATPVLQETVRTRVREGPGTLRRRVAPPVLHVDVRPSVEQRRQRLRHRLAAAMVAQPMQRRLPGSASAVPQPFTEEGAGSQFRCSGVCPEGEVGGLSATSLRSLGDLSAIALCPEVKSAVFGDAPAASSALLARRGSTPNTQ